MVHLVTSKGKSLGLCLAVCKIEASERYIQSLPVVLKDKKAASLKANGPLYSCLFIICLTSRSCL